MCIAHFSQSIRRNPQGHPKPAIQVTTDPSAPSEVSQGPPALPKPSTSACEPYRQFIEQGLARGRNAMAIWQDLVSDRGFTACYQTVKRFVLKPRGTQCTSDVRSLEVSAAYFISFLSFMSEGAFAAKLCCRMRAPRQIPVEGIFVFRVGVFVKTNRLSGHLSVWPKCAGGPLPKG